MEDTQQHKAFLLLLALVSVAFFWLLLPFYGAVFWAAVLAIVFQPLHRAFEKRFGSRSNLAALMSLLVCIVIAIIPMALLLGALVGEGTRLVTQVQQGTYDTTTIFADLHAALPPWLQHLLDRLGVGDFDALRVRLTTALKEASQFLAARALSVGQGTLSFFVSAGIMLYVLYFFFRDGRSIARNIIASMPLADRYNRALIEKFTAVVRATVKGNIVIAVVQGTIGGVAFWFLGISGALLWGTLMIFLSLLPAIGSALVWAPVAGYLFLTGSTIKGFILVGVGAGVIGLVDNFLRPRLVGGETRMPDWVILVSTLGGISIFGINGFVIGPLIAALFLAAWTLFRDEKAAAARAGLAPAQVP